MAQQPARPPGIRRPHAPRRGPPRRSAARVRGLLRTRAAWRGQGLKGNPMSPTPTNGKICYIEIPATDIARSAEFYKRVFGWNVRTRDNGSTAFDDTTGQVSGSWVRKRPPASQPGLLVYMMV